MSNEEPQIPEEFPKIIKDFVLDMKSTFPEYQIFISKWWKDKDSYDHIEDAEERKNVMNKGQENCIKFLFKFCLKKYPPRFFDILYQNNEIFGDDSEADTEFLPYIHFKNLWQQTDISDKTRETIWKYLQMIMFSVVGSINNREAFGDSAKLFEAMNEDEFKQKLEESLDQMKGIFDNSGKDPSDAIPQPNVEHLHEHITGMLGGKLGQLAKEIAEETAQDMNFDMDGSTDVKGVFQNLFKNPGKLMGLVKNVGEKLDSRLKSGEIKESELIKEASEMMSRMKDTPGMGDIQSMLKRMGLNTNGAKLDLNGMNAKLAQTMKTAQMKEKMKEKADINRAAREMAAQMTALSLIHI